MMMLFRFVKDLVILFFIGLGDKHDDVEETKDMEVRNKDRG
jgi:hypothetical protein